ncbi:hypothetical protein D3C78_1456290 [compost metagenome]
MKYERAKPKTMLASALVVRQVSTNSSPSSERWMGSKKGSVASGVMSLPTSQAALLRKNSSFATCKWLWRNVSSPRVSTRCAAM